MYTINSVSTSGYEDIERLQSLTLQEARKDAHRLTEQAGQWYACVQGEGDEGEVNERHEGQQDRCPVCNPTKQSPEFILAQMAVYAKDEKDRDAARGILNQVRQSEEEASHCSNHMSDENGYCENCGGYIPPFMRIDIE